MKAVPVPLTVESVILILPVLSVGSTSITGLISLKNVLLPSAYSCSPMVIVASKTSPENVANLLVLSKALNLTTLCYQYNSHMGTNR